MTQELQARIYDVLRLVVGSDIAQPKEREFALATAVELTKEYPFIGFEGPIETLPKKGTFDWALTMMRAQPGKAYTVGANRPEFRYDAELGGFEYLTDSAPWRVLHDWGALAEVDFDWREVSTEVAQNAEGPFDRETAVSLMSNHGLTMVCSQGWRHRFSEGVEQDSRDGKEWISVCATTGCNPYTPVHNLAWAKWAMKQGVVVTYNRVVYRWSGSEFEARIGFRGWGGTSLNSDGWDPGSEDWQVAK